MNFTPQIMTYFWFFEILCSGGSWVLDVALCSFALLLEPAVVSDLSHNSSPEYVFTYFN